MTLVWIIAVVAFFWTYSKATDKDTHGEALFVSLMAAAAAFTVAAVGIGFIGNLFGFTL